MQPPALRLQALQLLQLLLEDASLAQLFEGSLAQAAAARGEAGPPTATAGTSGVGEGNGASSTPGREAVRGGGAAGHGVQPLQAEGGEVDGGGPWIGAAVIAERLLDSLMLDDSLAPAAEPSSSRGVGASAAAAASAEPCGIAVGGTAVARAAMQLAASLREHRQQGILVALLLDDACGAPGCMLAQRLVQLAEAALALPGEEVALMLLCPLQWPQDGSSSSAGGAGTLLHRQAAWQQRLRVAQEALTLLRGLLVDDSCSESEGGVVQPRACCCCSLRAASRCLVNKLARMPCCTMSMALNYPAPALFCLLLQAWRPWMIWPPFLPPPA